MQSSRKGTDWKKESSIQTSTLKSLSTKMAYSKTELSVQMSYSKSSTHKGTESMETISQAKETQSSISRMTQSKKNNN